MLIPGSTHPKLTICVSPQGEFWHPTYPEGYCEGQAIAETMLGVRKFFFQRVEIQKQRSFFSTRLVWKALDETRRVDNLQNWQILRGRAYLMPLPVGPQEAQHLRNQKTNSAG